MKCVIPVSFGKYSIVAEIGRGSFARICKAFNRQTQQYVAIKFIDRAAAIKYDMFEYIEREIRFLSMISHSSFIKIHEIMYDPTYIMVVMDYCENGNLIEFLNKGITLTRYEKMIMLHKILLGIEYLHKRGIAHRDIKLENIVVDANFEPKIIDLGLSHDKASMLNTYCGTPTYIAPELAMNKPYDGYKSDIWSFGVLAHLLLTGRVPFNFVSETKFIRDVRKGELKVENFLGGEFGPVISQCLEIDPMRRPTASELVQMFGPFVNQKGYIMNFNSNKNIAPKLIPIHRDLIRCNTYKIIVNPCRRVCYRK